MKAEKIVDVRYNETDEMGVVYHANYLVWFDLGRTSFFENLGFSIVESREKGILFPVREINIKYLKPARFGDKVKIVTSILEFNNVKTIYAHEIYNQNDELLVQGTSTIVCVDAKTFRPVRLSEYLPDAYEVYQKITNKNQ